MALTENGGCPDFIRISLSNQEIIHHCKKNEITNITIFLLPQKPILVKNPYFIKREILNKVTHKSAIKNIRRSRVGTFIIEINSLTVAEEILVIREIQGVPVEKQIARKNVISEFIIHNVGTELPLTEIQIELKDLGLKLM